MKGFTLTEIIIYTAIFALISGAMVSYVLLMNRIEQKRAAMSELLYAGERIDIYLRERLREADSIANPPAGMNGHVLVINTQGQEYSIACVDNELLAANGSGAAVLHPARVYCRNLSFDHIGPDAGALKYELELYTGGDSREFRFSLPVGNTLLTI